jgi:hypothetical protein
MTKTRFEKRLRKLGQRIGVARETKTWMIYIVSEAGQRDTPYAELVWSKELGSTMTLLAANQT